MATWVEIGWRVRSDAWGAGYAREAAEASIAWGWANLACDAIHAITTVANVRSRGLMERLGMKRLPDLDFDHPAVPADCRSDARRGGKECVRTCRSRWAAYHQNKKSRQNHTIMNKTHEM